MPRSANAAVLAAVLLATACCGGEERAGEGYVIRGALLDAETGEPVSRREIYLHFFHDPTGVQVSLDPESGSDFEVRLPAAEVRIRVADTSDAYELFQETVALTDRDTRFDVKLRPTHYVLVRGRLRGVAPTPSVPSGTVGGNGPLLYFSAPGGFSRGPLWHEEDGTWEVRVPRAQITAQAVDTAQRITNPTLELTDFKGSEMTWVLNFE